MPPTDARTNLYSGLGLLSRCVCAPRRLATRLLTDYLREEELTLSEGTLSGRSRTYLFVNLEVDTGRSCGVLLQLLCRFTPTPFSLSSREASLNSLGIFFCRISLFLRSMLFLRAFFCLRFTSSSNYFSRYFWP